MIKSEKVANIKTNKKSFFLKWIAFTKPFHGLRNQLQSTLALILYHHYELGKVIKNDKILWKQVFDYDTKVKIMEELDIQNQSLENLLSELRRKKVIVNNVVSPLFVPNIQEDTEFFSININFKLEDE